MAVDHDGRDEPDSGAEPPDLPAPPAQHGLVRTWFIARTALQLTELFAGQHEGLHLAVQALLVLGDLAVDLMGREQRR